MKSTIAKVLGVVFVLVGILGFFSDPLLGLFEVDTVHNIVHIVLGLVLLAMANKKGLLIVGVLYLIVAILGFVMGEGELLGLFHVNTADNWLHLVLAVVLLGSACCAGKGGASAPSAPASSMGGGMGSPMGQA